MSTQQKDSDASAATDGYVAIERAAIRADSGRVYSLPAPKRHHHIIPMLADAGERINAYHKQGFLTSDGEFVDRQEAVEIAERAGQVEKGKHARLFSEDLW